MEFIRYKQSFEQSANDMMKHFMEQIEERELFYKKLLDKKEKEYQKHSSLKDNEIAVLSQCKHQLEIENRRLKEDLDKINRNSTEISGVRGKQDKAILPIDEEDYQQLIDDIQKAYIIESQRIVEYCLDDLLKYCEGYKAYIQTDDFWSIVFVAYTCDRHREIYEVYVNQLSPNQHKCHEHELYIRLLELSNADVKEENFEDIKKYIRDTSKDMLSIYPYIKNELLAEMSEVVEQMHQDFLINEENKDYKNTEEVEIDSTPANGVENEGETLTGLIKELLATCEEEKQIKVDETNQNETLYTIQEIDEAIKRHIHRDEWEQLKGVFKYIIKNQHYYQLLFDAKTFYEYLLISYIIGYEEVFAKKFAKAREELMKVKPGYDIYRMLEDEKNMSFFTIQFNCASRAIDQSKVKKDIFNGFNRKKLLNRLKKSAIPHTNKLQVVKVFKKLGETSKNIWEKHKVFVKTTEGKMILIEAWKRDATGPWFITTQTYQNIKDKIDAKQIRIIDNLEAEGLYNQNNKLMGIVNSYNTKDSTETSINKDTLIGEIPLNEKSPLKVLGYDTTKSKEERWRILTQQAIPKLGKAKVVWYINFFIKLHRSKPTMVSAIKEWEYDLRRLGAK